MAPRLWTENEKNTIINLYTKEGLTCTEIGRKYAAKADTISKYLKQWGIEIKGNRTANRLLNEDYFSIINTPNKAYFLGLLFADGSVTLDSKRSPRIRLELIEEDQNILQKFRDELNSDSAFRYDKRANRENGTYTFGVRNLKLATDLAKYNILPNKTYNVTELIIPDNYKIDYLRGLIDGDGSIYFSQNLWHINFCGHSENIVSQVANLGCQLLNISKHKITCSDNVYRYTWHGQDAIKLADLLYTNAETAITRKRLKATVAQEDKKS